MCARSSAHALASLLGLSLTGNEVGESGARAALEMLPVLKVLVLGKNRLGDAGLLALVRRCGRTPPSPTCS